MADPLLTQILRRIDDEPCVICHDEVIGRLAPVWSQLVNASLIREITPARYAPCPDCGQHTRSARGIVHEQTGDITFLIACPDCGPCKLSQDALRRYTIDLERLLADLCRLTGMGGNPTPVVPTRLWRLGIIPTVGTRSRVAFFARVPSDIAGAPVAEMMSHHPASVLFFATPSGVGAWQRPMPGVQLALSELITLGRSGLEFNMPSYAACLRAFEDDQSQVRKSPVKTPRRSRADKIQKLESELTEFIRSAQDHAFDTKVRTGTPELLARPTQQEFAQQVGFSDSTLSRILKRDKAGHTVRILWKLTEDLEGIMRWDRKVRH